jgi:hypothetical protein
MHITRTRYADIHTCMHACIHTYIHTDTHVTLEQAPRKIEKNLSSRSHTHYVGCLRADMRSSGCGQRRTLVP